MPDAQVIAVVRSLERFTERTIQRLTLDIDATLRSEPSAGGTPRDTGWARANWIPNVGAPAPPPDGTRPPSGSTIGATPEQAAGLARVARYVLRQGAIYLTNNVPYITRLNDGHSRQAPAGFVQAAIRRGINRITRTRGR